MKRLPIVLALPLLAALGACMDHGRGPGPDASVAVSGDYYDGYYDGAYGPFYDGYWGDDGFFWYRDGGSNWHRDDAHHFARASQNGFNHIHGSGMKREH